MTTDPVRRATAASSRTPWLTRAWTAVGLVPFFFLVPFAVGAGLYALTGHRSASADAPLWIVTVVHVAVLAVALVPCAAAVLFGRRAMGSGARRGLLPVLVGVVAGAGLVVLSPISSTGGLLR